MMATQLALIRRELWEHRSLYVVPAVLILISTLISVTGQVAVSAAEREIDLAILGAANLSDEERAAAINVLLTVFSWIFVVTMGVVTIFYALDALYAERRDKSILFWRSLPVTDWATVVSKLLTASVVIPVITLAAIGIAHVLILIASSLWIAARGVDAFSLIWGAAPLFDNWAATLIVLLALSIWVSPFVGWFLFVSGFTKRSPFLTAFLPLIVLPMLERILIGTTLFTEMLLARMPFAVPIIRRVGEDEFAIESESELLDLAREGISLLSFIDVGRFLGSPSVWIGAVVCGLFCTAAVYVRRYRDES